MRIMDQGHPAATRRVVVRHHALVRLAHWANVPVLLGLVASGLSIYWASPVHQHRSIRPPTARITWRISLLDLASGARDLGRSGRLVLRPFRWDVSSGASDAVALAARLPLHDDRGFSTRWLASGGGFKVLLPRRSASGRLPMLGYYLGVAPASYAPPWPHPRSSPSTIHCSALSTWRCAARLLAVRERLAMHKPSS